VTCNYCRATIDADSHRCGRCGRKLNDDVFPVQMGAAVPVVDLAPQSAPKPQAPPPARPQLMTELPRTAPPRLERPVQASLFGPMEVKKGAPGRVQQRPAAAQQRRPRVDRSAQRGFEFVVAAEAQAGAHTLPTSVAAAVSCNARVADPSRRVLAAAIDAAIPLAGFTVFLMTLHMVSDGLALSMKTLPFFAAAAGLIAIFYRVLCCLGNSDTIGLQWAGLQLLNFDGHRPDVNQRLRRLAGGLLSTGALTIGLLWALVDEEQLAWHDYISNTFPTSRIRNS
jgi:uncharacterized RDD family membrane protein YckC